MERGKGSFLNKTIPFFKLKELSQKTAFFVHKDE